MARINVAFWNVQNLFDTTASDIAADLEFTPADGWTEEILAVKIKNLASVINLLHDGQGPDLLGLAEVENKSVVDALVAATGRSDLRVAHIESPDIRGIDTSLVYSTRVFKTPKASEMTPHLIHFRYPTRDIFEVHLTLVETGAELAVLVNHWPSRTLGQFESEPMRITVAQRCGQLVDNYLKLPREGFLALPNTAESLAHLNQLWNRNVLIMGDLNDEPYARSVLDYLLGAKDLDHVEEDLKPAGGRKIPEARSYCGKAAYLLNCMWPLLGRPDHGTYFFSGGTNTMSVLDQFLVSKGLYFGKQKLRLVPESVRIFAAPPIADGKGRPRAFDRKTKKGYSDHFPITAVIETV